MTICYKCGEGAYIRYDNHFLCSKHYNLAVNEIFKKIMGGYNE